MASSRLALVLVLGMATGVQADSTPGTVQLRREAFEHVWAKIRDHYHDPSFGGLDWTKVGDEFRGRLATVKTDAEFHALLAEMLGRLGGSHTRIISEELYALAMSPGDDKPAEGATPAESGSPGTVAEPKPTKGV